MQCRASAACLDFGGPVTPDAGALVVADNAGRALDFLENVRSSGRYLSVDVGGDVEVSLLV